MHKLAEAYLSFHPTLHPERLDQPSARKKPAVIGVCFMGDLFDNALEYYDRTRVFHAMDDAPQHTYIILTKQPRRMMNNIAHNGGMAKRQNWHLGFSARTQEEFDDGWPHMAKLAAAGWKVWVSLEPLLSGMNITKALRWCPSCKTTWYLPPPDGICKCRATITGLSGVIVGEQSGPHCPPFDWDWVRSLRDQCAAAGVPFMFKQARKASGGMVSLPELDGHDGVFRVHKELAW
jgi:protein gp37